MHQRISARNRMTIGIAALLLLSVVTLTQAQTASQEPSNLPILLLVSQHPLEKTMAFDDLNYELKSTLRSALMISERFQVHSFTASDPIIKRAMTDHNLSADELVEPFRPESLHRIALAVGAKYLLVFHAALDKNDLGKSEMATRIRYEENISPETWITRSEEKINWPVMTGKKRLKQSELIGLTVDSIAGHLGVVSHFNSRIPALNPADIVVDANKKKKNQKPPRTKAANIDNDPVVTSGDPFAVPVIPTENIVKPTTVKPIPEKGRKKDASTVKKSDPPIIQATFGQPPTTTVESIIGTSPTNLPPKLTKPNYEELANRFRTAGDMANLVTALRRAVNDSPRDISLRQQLIQAYQNNSMIDSAETETTRALLIEPNNGELYRLLGESQLAKGETAKALATFHEGVRLAPADIAIRLSLGDALLANSQYMEALDTYQEASRLAPKSPLPHRRLARALAGRAAADLTQYDASLKELQLASDLTPASESGQYLEDYIGLMRMADARLRGMIDEAQAANQGRVQGKRTPDQLLRTIADIKLRAESASDFLEKMPAAVGQEVTQAHYKQAAALVLQSLGFFHDLIVQGDDRFLDQMKNAQVQAQRELTTATKRLTAPRGPVESKNAGS